MLFPSTVQITNKDSDTLLDSICRSLSTLLKVFSDHSCPLKLLSKENFKKKNSTSILKNSDQEVLSTISTALNIKLSESEELAVVSENGIFYFCLDDVVPPAFISKINENISRVIQATFGETSNQIHKESIIEEDNEEEVSIQEESDTEEESVEEEETSGMAICQRNIHSLLDLVLFTAKFNKKMLFKVVSVTNQIILELGNHGAKNLTEKSLLIFESNSKVLIKKIFEGLFQSLGSKDFPYKEAVSRKLSILAWVFWDCCRNQGLGQLVEQLKRNNIRRQKSSRYISNYISFVNL